MSLVTLREWLREPQAVSLDVNGADVSIAHREILLKKRMLRELFLSFYRRCRYWDDRCFAGAAGKRLEVGSGSSIIQECYPDVITSDIKPLPFVNLVAPAEDLPFDDGALRAIYGINVFHHFPDPPAFFRECLRVLATGGGVVLIDPYYGPLARWLFPRLHASEDFHPDVADWVNPQQVGPCQRANQALSYIVFRRDLARFRREYPQLELLVDQPHTHLMYFLSGGVNYRQFVPDGCTRLVQLAEKLLTPCNRWLALQHTVVLRKRS